MSFSSHDFSFPHGFYSSLTYYSQHWTHLHLGSLLHLDSFLHLGFLLHLGSLLHIRLGSSLGLSSSHWSFFFTLARSFNWDSLLDLGSIFHLSSTLLIGVSSSLSLSPSNWTFFFTSALFFTRDSLLHLLYSSPPAHSFVCFLPLDCILHFTLLSFFTWTIIYLDSVPYLVTILHLD